MRSYFSLNIPGPVAARDIARRSPGLPEVNSLATEQAEVGYQTATPSSTSIDFALKQSAEEVVEAAATFGEGHVHTSSSVDVLEISTNEGGQTNAVDGAGSPNQNCSGDKENHSHHDQVQVGAISFNVPLCIPPAR